MKYKAYKIYALMNLFKKLKFFEPVIFFSFFNYNEKNI
jgi:hypothetical protein